MPDPIEPNTDWTTWIIGTLMTVLFTVVGTVVSLAKMIESKYRKEIEELRKEINELQAEAKLCQEDRLALSVRVASLEHIKDLVNPNKLH